MINMFEAKSFRVKGISFHPKNSWVLTSLHNGEIILYDYVIGILLEKYIEHEGPVRAVCFHNTQPFFVSGGDDCKIKIWNYTTKKCQYNLGTHNDYIRTVQFHYELPWVISSSDDQTIRIWNWLNRTLLTTVTGHDHYVMSAFFHPSQDLIVSASLDQTIRVWDYSTLRKKFFEVRATGMEVITMDITVKYRMEGHERGVNWAVFHPKLPLIASGSDDKNIKIWKFTDTKWTEADTLRGHFNNVSSVIFHPRLDYLISNSEDRSMRVWDLNKKTYVEKITKEVDRFWILAIHPTLNIFASGCDSGFNVFKLESSKMPSTTIQNQILLYHDKKLKLWKAGETDKRVLMEFKTSSKSILSGVKRIIYNPFQNTGGFLNFFIITDVNVGRKVYYFYLKYDNKGGVTGADQVLEFASSAAFISSNKVLTLTLSGSLVGYDIANLNNKFVLELPGVSKDALEAIYQGPLGKFICKFKNEMIALIDANSRKIIKEINEITDLKYVIWNSTLTLAALVTKNNLYVINKNFEILTKIKENCTIKSTCFDEQNIIFYSTNFHIKYLLPNGLSGIIKSTEMTNYLMMVVNSTIYCNDALQNFKNERFNYTECKFKIALQNKNYDEVVNILKSGSIYGIKAVEDIKNAGFPDLSLKFVTDPKQKFDLALQSGKLEEAEAAADILKDKTYYALLAEKAMMMGKLAIAERCYVRSKNLDKLMFFYLLSGRYDKLKVLDELLHKENDNSRRFLNSIYTGNIHEKIKLLAETGHLSLALLSAKIFKNEQFQNSLIQNSSHEIEMNEDDVENYKTQCKPIIPLKSILSHKNKAFHSDWNILTEFKKATLMTTNLDNIMMDKNEIMNNESDNNFGSILNETVVDTNKDVNTTTKKEDKKKEKKKSKFDDEEEQEDNYEVPEDEVLDTNEKSTQHLTFQDDDIVKKNFENSRIPGIQLMLGNLQLCINLLKSQVCLDNQEPLKNIMKDLYMSNYSQVKFLPFVRSSELNLRSSVNTGNSKIFYNTYNTIKYLNNKLQSGYDLTTEGETEAALKVFREILKHSLFFVPCNKEEEKEIQNIISICSEYIYLLRLNIVNKEQKDKTAKAESACLMTICKLEQPVHYFYMYRKAKVACVNIKNYITASYFCKKIISLEKTLESEIEEEDFRKIKKEYENFQKIGTNAVTLEFNINEMLPNIKSIICGNTFTRLKESNPLKCPLCQSSFNPKFAKSVCDCCNLCILGKECLGLHLIDEL